MLRLAAIVFVVVMSGQASRYDPGIFERVIANRQHFEETSPGHLPDLIPSVDGYIAMKDCDEIGSIKIVEIDHCDDEGRCETVRERFWVVDCAAFHDGTREWMDRSNVILEWDFESAVRHGGVPWPIPVRIVEERSRYEFE